MVNVELLTTNVTSGETNVTVDPSLLPAIVALNYGSLLISLTVVVMETMVVAVLQKCRRIPQLSRWLSLSFILSDLLGALMFAAHQLFIFVFGYNNDITRTSRIVAVGALLTLSWASVALMAIDRVLAIKMNLRYSSWNKHNMLRFGIGFLWLFHIIVVIVLCVIGVQSQCGFDLKDCDAMAATKVARFTMMSMLVVYELLVVVSYIYIFKVASRHARAINALKVTAFREKAQYPSNLSDRQINTTNAVLKIVLAFWVLHAPIIIHLFLVEFETSLKNEIPLRMFHAFSYTCIQINSFVSMSLYAGKFKEVKMRFYFLFGKICQRYQQKGEALRIDVFNIVISAEAGLRRASLLS